VPRQALLQVELPIPLNANRERFSLMGSRSADLVEGLPSPLLCAPARRPAHLLGYLASPRLGCLLPRLPASGHHLLATTWPRLCTPAACTGAGVPTRGTSYWGHPFSESNVQGGGGGGYVFRPLQIEGDAEGRQDR
jgi:hypothetical protein